MGGKITPEKKKLVEEEINQMPKKGAIIKVDPNYQYFYRLQERWGQQTSDKLKKLQNFIHSAHFKIECFFLVGELLSPNDWMYKVDLKDVYFSITIQTNSQKNLRFKWEGSLYHFLYLCVGLSRDPLVFTKLLKVSIALLRKLKV